MHLGFVCLAVGIAGSSLGKREQGFVLTEGQTIEWAGREIHLVRMVERELPEKLVAEAELRVTDQQGHVINLRPAQHFHRLQEQWTTEVDIHVTWKGDFYAILHSGDLDGKLYMTFVENPLMRGIWLGGAIAILGTIIRIWPSRRRNRKAARLDVHDERKNAGQRPPPSRRAAA